MTTPKPGSIYLDRDGRQIKLERRTDPQGPTPAYWGVLHVDTGRQTTIREDRLDNDYTPLDRAES